MGRACWSWSANDALNLVSRMPFSKIWEDSMIMSCRYLILVPIVLHGIGEKSTLGNFAVAWEKRLGSRSASVGRPMFQCSSGPVQYQ